MISSALLYFVGGLIYGSFLNMLLWRLPRNEGVGGRSRCRHCNHDLAWYDLIPVISFILLAGKCRYCAKKISLRYPLVELATGAVLSLFFIVRNPAPSLDTALTIYGLLTLVSLFFFDIFYFILPDVVIFPAIIIYGIYDTSRPEKLLSFLLTALLVGAFFAILHRISRGKKLGFGDVKFAILIGLMFGYPIGILSIILGIWIATLVALILLTLRKVGMQDAIPLGSFLAISSILFIIFQNEALSISTLFR